LNNFSFAGTQIFNVYEKKFSVLHYIFSVSLFGCNPEHQTWCQIHSLCGYKSVSL